MSRALKILLSFAVVGTIIGGLIYSSMESKQYFLDVSQLLENPKLHHNSSIKVRGFVEAGSIVEDPTKTMERTFILAFEGKRVRVHHTGLKPDTFRDLSDVVASGTLVLTEHGEYMLQSNELTAKCPSKYEENQRSRQASVL